SHARRAAQSALHHITQAMMRLMAPILSFTADEIWQTLGMDAEATVFEDVWYELPVSVLSEAEIAQWQAVLEVRALANKAIEEQRAQGLVGSSLQSELDIPASCATHQALARLVDDLRFVLIVSRAVLHELPEGDVRIDV